MLLKRNGSVTVFICILLSVLIPLCCILTDLSRYSMAKKQVKTAVRISAESMLAAYDRQLKEQYGLLSLYPRDKASMEEEIYELLSRNLNTEASVEGVSDIYDFKVRKVEAVPFYNLSEPFVLEQQVAEFMKYRAPVQTVQEFYEKIQVMLGLMKEAETAEKKIELDTLMNDIRGSLTKVHCMMEKPLKEFNSDPDGGKGTLCAGILKGLAESAKSAGNDIGKANSEVQAITEAQDRIISVYPTVSRAKEACESAKAIVDDVDSRLESKKTELKSLEDQLKGAKEAKKPELYNRINNLKADISALQEEYSSASKSFQQATSGYMDLENTLDSYQRDLDAKLDTVLLSLNGAIGNCTGSKSELERLKAHITLHERYNSDLIKVIDGLTPQLNELESKSGEFLSEAQEEDSAIADRAGGSLDKQLKCIKKETFSTIRSQLEENLKKLKNWEQALDGCLSGLEKVIGNLNNALASAGVVKSEPQNDGNRYMGVDGFESLQTSVTSLDAAFSPLKTKTGTNQVYKVPEYSLEPKPNQVEYDSFARWFNQQYNGASEAVPKPKPENPDLKKIRDSVSDFAGIIGDESEEEEDEGSDLSTLEADAKAQLPTSKGATSSEPALSQIGKAILESSRNSTVSENPFDKPAEGLDSVDEKQKGFFNFEIDRILALGRLLKDACANGIESMMESLYVNEYVVSAFQCATTEDHVIEHDIGWGRPIDSSFFEKAEVEYVLFGNEREAANLASAKRSLFSIRLVFNLLHVYSDPDKLATTLSLATSIAGWTIFGIPVVQNFLLISWAALESYIDATILMKGGRVPLVKTSSSWYLEAGSLADSLKNIFLKKVREFAADKLGNVVEDASKAIEETVSSIIDSKIDLAFSKAEQAVGQVTEAVGTVTMQEVDSLFAGGFLTQLSFEDMDSFSESLEMAMKDFAARNLDKLASYTSSKLAEVKSMVKTKIRSMIFESSLYSGLKEKVKAAGEKLLDKGISAAEDGIDKVLGKAGGSRSSNITGRLVMMDYTDYLRLMLLAVPAEKKALRTADLMQLNMQKAADNNEISMDQYKTYIFIKAEVDFNTWFLPESLFKKGDGGMISVEWSQGY